MSSKSSITNADASHTSLWFSSIGLVLLVGLATRSVLATLAPPFPDETYYWEWARRLQPGYFDHAPGIAYVIAAGRAFFGETTAGIRFGPAILAITTHLAATRLALNLGGKDAAFRAALLTLVLPIATLGMVLATPDAPLFACTMLALVFFERALAAAPNSARSTWWWCAAGIATGAALLSKYTAVLVPFGLFVACVVHPALRVRLREPGPYVAAAIGALMFVPVIMWNVANDWVSFRFQLTHGFGAGAKGNVLTRELELVGGQLGLATPILAVLMGIAVVAALRVAWRDRTTMPPTDSAARHFALAMMAVVPLAFFAVSATRKPVEANWPALMYPGAIAVLAASQDAFARGKWWRWGIGVAVALLAVAVLQVWKPILPVTPRKDPIARAYGWDQLAATVDSMRRDPFLGETTDVWVAAVRYQEASELAFHLPDHPNVLSLNLASRPNQYDFWLTAASAIRPGDGMVATFDANPDGDTRARQVAAWFRDVHEGPVVALKRGNGEVAHRKVWLFRFAQQIP